MNRLSLAAASSFVALILQGCGGGASGSVDPPGFSGPLTASTGPLVDGVVWQINRPIDITFDRPVDFGSVNTLSVAVQTAQGGIAALGAYSLGIDPITGVTDPNVVRFQPSCPAVLGDPVGLELEMDYVLILRGADTTSAPLLAQDGTEFENTLEVAFSTPAGSNPDVVFFDSRPGPPGLVIRGRGGVSLDDPSSTRFELGRYAPARVDMRDDGFGGIVVDPGSITLVPFGLPLNHYIERRHQVALVAEFDQPVRLSADNLERIWLEYLDGSFWRRVPCRVEPLVGCGRRGSTVRLRPLGTLPPGLPLRVKLRGGFEDLVGQSENTFRVQGLPLEGTTEQSPEGARVDALLESFTVGGNDPDSMEDVISDLGAPRGFWGSGFIAGIETPDGVSRVRSKWYPVGLAGNDGAGAPQRPDFYFFGTDVQGVVAAQGGSVTVGSPVIGPVAPSGIANQSVDIDRADLAEPNGLYTALPSLLCGDRLRMPLGSGSLFEPRVFTVEGAGAQVRLGVGSGCYAPGVLSDCVPWDLTAMFPDPSSARVEVIPQSFEIYNWFTRDVHSTDHRVTITFDAAQADGHGNPAEGSALSQASGWTTDVTSISGGQWDFVRFEVQFELDVSGDGYHPLERSPGLDFIKIPVDFRR